MILFFLVMCVACGVASHPPTRKKAYVSYYGAQTPLTAAQQQDMEMQYVGNTAQGVPVYIESNDPYYDYMDEHQQSGGGCCYFLFCCILTWFLLGFYIPRSPVMWVSSQAPLYDYGDQGYRMTEILYLSNYNYFGISFYQMEELNVKIDGTVCFTPRSGQASMPSFYIPSRATAKKSVALYPDASSSSYCTTQIKDWCAASSSIKVQVTGTYSTSLGTYGFNNYQWAICPY